MHSVKKFVRESKELREYLPQLTKKQRRAEWISYWWGEQIAAASW